MRWMVSLAMSGVVMGALAIDAQCAERRVARNVRTASNPSNKPASPVLIRPQLTANAPGPGPVLTPHPQVEELPGPELVPGLPHGAQYPPAGGIVSVFPASFPTHAEFARSFQPLPGQYEVVLMHPYSCQPVKICFALPDACLKKTRVEKGELEFDYGKLEVELRFKRDGRVNVEYRD